MPRTVKHILTVAPPNETSHFLTHVSHHFITTETEADMKGNLNKLSLRAMHWPRTEIYISTPSRPHPQLQEGGASGARTTVNTHKAQARINFSSSTDTSQGNATYNSKYKHSTLLIKKNKNVKYMNCYPLLK